MVGRLGRREAILRRWGCWTRSRPVSPLGRWSSSDPTGSSMAPLIRSWQRVRVVPVDAARVEVGDIVLARLAGPVYLHLVSTVDPIQARMQISNNRGRINGWTSHAKVFGICTRGQALTPRYASPT
jgi:hypothetical protein